MVGVPYSTSMGGYTALMRDDRGFTLIELLVVISLASMLVAVGALSLRTYWMRQSLSAGASELTSHMRQAQSSAQSRSLPRVYGVRFTVNTDDWAFVQYDPADTTGPCLQYEERSFSAGVLVSEASFAASTVTDLCSGPGGLRDSAGNLIPVTSADRFAFFFPRGDATAGSVTLQQTLAGGERMITVNGTTGRVEEQ